MIDTFIYENFDKAAIYNFFQAEKTFFIYKPCMKNGFECLTKVLLNPFLTIELFAKINFRAMKVWEKQTDLKFHKTTKKDAKEMLFK